MRELAGRTAIVTGASEGLGVHIARALAKEGMHLGLAARSAEKLDSLATELKSDTCRALAIPTDVTELAALERLVDRTLEQFGQIDVLVNNAGVESFHRYHTLDVEAIRRTIDVNLTATLVLTRLVLPHMLARGQGHVVNMASTAGKLMPPYGAAYAATKAGLIAFTHSIRREYHATPIRASVICPGFADEGGMYELIKKQTGRKTPFLMGSTNAPAVVKAVLRAIKKDVPEIIVNDPPMRPMTMLAEMSPSLGGWIVRTVGNRFFERLASARERTGSGGRQ